jgi:hypothetical protein
MHTNTFDELQMKKLHKFKANSSIRNELAELMAGSKGRVPGLKRRRESGE